TVIAEFCDCWNWSVSCWLICCWVCPGGLMISAGTTALDGSSQPLTMSNTLTSSISPTVSMRNCPADVDDGAPVIVVNCLPSEDLRGLKVGPGTSSTHVLSRRARPDSRTSATSRSVPLNNVTARRVIAKGYPAPLGSEGSAGRARLLRLRRTLRRDVT